MPVKLIVIEKPEVEVFKEASWPEAEVKKTRHKPKHRHRNRHEKSSTSNPGASNHPPVAAPPRRQRRRDVAGGTATDPQFSITNYIQDQVHTAVRKIPGIRWLTDTASHPIAVARQKLSQFDGGVAPPRNAADGSWLYPTPRRRGGGGVGGKNVPREIDIDALKRRHKKKVKKEARRSLRKQTSSSTEMHVTRTELRAMFVEDKNSSDAFAEPPKKLFTIGDVSVGATKRYKPKNLVKLTPDFEYNSEPTASWGQLPTSTAFTFTPRLLQYETERASSTLVCNVAVPEVCDTMQDFRLQTPDEGRRVFKRREMARSLESKETISPLASPHVHFLDSFETAVTGRRCGRPDAGGSDFAWDHQGKFVASLAGSSMRPLPDEHVYETESPSEMRRRAERPRENAARCGMNDFSEENFLSLPKYVQVLPSTMATSSAFSRLPDERRCDRKYPKTCWRDEFEGFPGAELEGFPSAEARPPAPIDDADEMSDVEDDGPTAFPVFLLPSARHAGSGSQCSQATRKIIPCNIFQYAAERSLQSGDGGNTRQHEIKRVVRRKECADEPRGNAPTIVSTGSVSNNKTFEIIHEDTDEESEDAEENCEASETPESPLKQETLEPKTAIDAGYESAKSHCETDAEDTDEASKAISVDVHKQKDLSERIKQLSSEVEKFDTDIDELDDHYSEPANSDECPVIWAYDPRGDEPTEVLPARTTRFRRRSYVRDNLLTPSSMLYRDTVKRRRQKGAKSTESSVCSALQGNRNILYEAVVGKRGSDRRDDSSESPTDTSSCDASPRCSDGQTGRAAIPSDALRTTPRPIAPTTHALSSGEESATKDSKLMRDVADVFETPEALDKSGDDTTVEKSCPTVQNDAEDDDVEDTEVVSVVCSQLSEQYLNNEDAEESDQSEYETNTSDTESRDSDYRNGRRSILRRFLDPIQERGSPETASKATRGDCVLVAANQDKAGVSAAKVATGGPRWFYRFLPGKNLHKVTPSEDLDEPASDPSLSRDHTTLFLRSAEDTPAGTSHQRGGNSTWLRTRVLAKLMKPKRPCEKHRTFD